MDVREHALDCPHCGHIVAYVVRRPRTSMATKIAALDDQWRTVATGAQRNYFYKLKDRYGAEADFQMRRLSNDRCNIEARRR